ncbi:Mucin-associated surface protein (MASP) [Trypanosoma cruzi]|uniref:Mucin-associated surface protein (MASP), putative n=2 Tax=Trypanosoma cruzi TaxID=5693 RepID=Q4D646_TRYCC|nr:mucin-associated surface protein (MASP), putative [Trypanosoma cruzi]EAN87998.1 mucin-associated surface protein (MASP), putative [Trypanosoma cruzi]PWV09726.1 Mucin-associated surface protein (MASP) [Trypanosoma cruzi]RNC39107.1 mucin-associated surface protein (MASP) [Trypanosoma cruzi]|eukprot:XP_809849.1 mucin-associated surface protein (MASP) [Trypanosoma cruzi strain CL Brener]
MAMTMTGRVLLVCALCVLWCGAGGRCDDVVTAALGSGGSSPKSTQLETPPLDSQELKDEAPVVKEEVPPASPGIKAEEEEDKDDDDTGEGDGQEDGGAEGEEKPIERQDGQGGTVAPGSGYRETNLSGSEQENHQSITPAGGISHSGSQESKSNPTQTEVEEKNGKEENTPAVENPLTTGNGENTLPAGIVEGNPSPPPPKDSVDSREQDGEGTTSEGHKNVPPPETAATTQSHREKGSEGSGENTKATAVTTNTTDKTSTQNTDSSTAVSHTTSPFLLLLVVAAAAAVVAA